MARGIDVYQKYQTVTDWAKVKGSGVTFVYIKGTDGGGLAPVHADAYVKGSKSVGLPTGLYHYAELTPSPEAQADVLTAEVKRLGADGLPPALDLESPFAPGSAARAFAQRFLNRLRANGFPVVTLYANTSMLTGISADTLGVPGVKIWAANYGVNDGTRHGYSYKGHADIHQYTSVGRVPGITGSVDMNESLTDISNKTEDDVAFTDQIKVAAPGNRSYVEQHEAAQVIGDTYFWAADTYQSVNNVLVPAVAALGAAVSNGTFDQAAFQAHLDVTLKKAIDNAVVPIVQQAMRDAGADEYAEAVVDLLQKRLGSGTQQPTA